MSLYNSKHWNFWYFCRESLANESKYKIMISSKVVSILYSRCSRTKSSLHSSQQSITPSRDDNGCIEQSRDQSNQPIRSERLELSSSSKIEPLSDSREFLSSSTDSLDGPPTHAFKLQRGKGFNLASLGFFLSNCHVRWLSMTHTIWVIVKTLFWVRWKLWTFKSFFFLSRKVIFF